MGLQPTQGKVQSNESDFSRTSIATAADAAPPMSKLETKEISKAYRGRRVVDDVSVFVQQGEVVGLLGPRSGPSPTGAYALNGAGRRLWLTVVSTAARVVSSGSG